MSALKEFANFITVNMANLATTYARLLAEGGQGYETWPANNRVASGRKLLKAVVEAFELESATPLIDIFNKNLTENQFPDAGSGASSSQESGDISPSHPLLEVECLGQTLTPVVPNLEAGKFLWQVLFDARATVLQDSPVVTGSLQKDDIVRDVTDRQRAEQELATERDLLQALLDNSPDYIFFKDAESRIIRSNKAHADLLGFADPQGVVGKTDFDLFSAEVAEWAYEEEQQIIQSGQPVIDRVGQTPDSEGNILWLSETKIPLTDETGQKSGLFGISRNITERKLAEEKLAKRAAELQAIADISTTTTAILERDQLLREVSNLTKERFDLYHAHIYLLDELGETLTLVAGAGEVGQQMVSEGWSIPIDQEQSLVAQVARTGEGVIVNDVQQTPHHLPNPLLPDTRSEMAVPLIVGGMVFGVLDVQSDRIDRFTQEDVQLKTALASQVAVALQNAEQYEFAQEASHLLGKRVQELNCLNELGREMEETPPLDELLQWVTERIPRAMQYPDLCETAIKFDDNVYGVAEAVDLPAQMTHGLYVKGDVLGRIYVAYTEKQDFLDEESAMLGAVATRLSGYIENRQLLEETETALAATKTLARELAVLNELGRALTTHLNVDEVLEETYRQTSRLIDTTNFYIGLYDSKKEEISFRFDVSESEIDRTIMIMPASQGIAGYMIRERTSLLFEDKVGARQEALGITMVGQEPKSWLGVPLIVGDRAVGVMAVQSFTTPGLYGEHERELLTAIANQAAVAIQNAGQFEAAQRQARREQTIREITDKMRAATSLEQVIKVAAEELGQRFSAEYALVELGTDVTEPHPNNRQTDGRE